VSVIVPPPIAAVACLYQMPGADTR